MRTTQGNSIESNMELAMALWPNASWTEQLQDLWIDRLKGLNQDIVAEAIRLVKPAYASHQPELKWILGKAGELAEQRSPRFLSGNQKPTFFHVTWKQRSRHGDWDVRYGRWCQSREEALAHVPAGCTPTITATDDSEDRCTRDELRAEEDEARQWLAQATREEIAGLLVHLRKSGFFKDKPLPARIGDWSRMQAMTVYAAYLMRMGVPSGNR